MTLAEAGNYAGNMAELNILYPWHGLEWLMALVCLVFWVGWHIWQFRMEDRNYSDDLKTLAREDNMQRVLKGERLLRPL
jgi:hypothetical protein